MIWDEWFAIFDFSELDFLAFHRCVLSENYDLGCVVCFLDFSELGFLVSHRRLLSETSSLG
jgi:hypothetical protein